MQNNFKYIGIVLLSLAVIALLVWLILIEQRIAEQSPTTPTPPSESSLQLEIPQKALWNNYVVVSALAAPGSTCSLLYIPPSGNSREMPTVANETGGCQWRWKIQETDGKGNGRLIFTIGGESETHFIEIRRSF